MDIHDILDHINLRHGTAFRLVGKYEHGENQGAFELHDAGRAYVLKYLERAGWLARIEHARQITQRLGERGAPVPSYVLVGELDDHWAYCVQTSLPGSPARTLSIQQARQLIAAIELQAGQGRASEPDWSSYTHAVVFHGESGWIESLRGYSFETRALLARMQGAVEPFVALKLSAVDIVHGDLALENVLIDDANISGIVDWDAAGRGDRILDYAKLLFYGYDNRPARELLRNHILGLRGPASVCVHLVYCILAQLDWSIHHHDARTVSGLVGQAHTMLDDLKRSTK